MNVNNALFSAEQVIDRSIIRSGEGHGGEEKQERFRKTAMAMQEIISKKLYKAKHSTMEQYFKEVFKLSRASVYRFVDASRVLNQLEGFHILPFGERQCRTLRRCTKDLQTIRLLWSTVLNKYGEDPSLITSTIIQNTWDEMIEKKLVDPSKISTIKSNNLTDKNNKKINKDLKTSQKVTSNNSLNNSMKSLQGINNVSKLMISTSGSSSNISDLSNMNMSQKFVPSYSSTATLVDSSNNNTLSDIAGLQIDDTGASIYTINCNNQSYQMTSQTQSPLNKNKNPNYNNFTSSLQSNTTLVATPTSTTLSISHTTNNTSPSNININSSSMTSINSMSNSNPTPENYIGTNVMNSNTSLNPLGYTIANQQNYIATTSGYTNTNFPARLNPNYQRRMPNSSTASMATSSAPTTTTYFQNYQYPNTNDTTNFNPEHFNGLNSNFTSQIDDYINFNNYNQGTYYTQTSQNSQYENHYSNYSSKPASSSYFPTSDVTYQWYGNDQTSNSRSQKYFSSDYYSQLRILNPTSDDVKSYPNQRVISNNYSLPYTMDSLSNIDNQNNSNRNINSRNINMPSENSRLNNNNSYTLNNYPYTVIGIVNSQNNIMQ